MKTLKVLTILAVILLIIILTSTIYIAFTVEDGTVKYLMLTTFSIIVLSIVIQGVLIEIKRIRSRRARKTTR